MLFAVETTLSSLVMCHVLRACDVQRIGRTENLPPSLHLGDGFFNFPCPRRRVTF
jgi:hypothetical protein